MFEEYLEDAYHFAAEGRGSSDDKVARRFYRASIFCAMSAIEAFINEIGDTFSKGGSAFPPHEIAFLIDRKFGITKNAGYFDVQETPEYHRLDEKIRFLINKFIPDFDFQSASWSRFKEFKKFRDGLIHPRDTEDPTSPSEYDAKVVIGLNAIGELMSVLCEGIFRRPLRFRFKELSGS